MPCICFRIQENSEAHPPHSWGLCAGCRYHRPRGLEWHAVGADLMQRYAAMVSDEILRTTILSRILDELKRTRDMLQVIYSGPSIEKRSNVHQMISLRRDPLTHLHNQPFALLVEWRKLPHGDSHVELLLSQLLLSINAIANNL